MNADEDLACQEPDEYAQKLNEKYQKELQLLYDYHKRQADPNIDEKGYPKLEP